MHCDKILPTPTTEHIRNFYSTKGTASRFKCIFITYLSRKCIIQFEEKRSIDRDESTMVSGSIEVYDKSVPKYSNSLIYKIRFSGWRIGCRNISTPIHYPTIIYDEGWEVISI
ncbi:hypothetical protein RF11_15219 [Thelohanellus kitauei]|uniref:Uncharacterized protein n=1 Tax=Thelohanellus kitauei TaxID=669202 RepID=A0A0C2J4G1_THEKT|nr:hypothetical protein RF11_15219 [Thelohanellus kitauei]